MIFFSLFRLHQKWLKLDLHCTCSFISMNKLFTHEQFALVDCFLLVNMVWKAERKPNKTTVRATPFPNDLPLFEYLVLCSSFPLSTFWTKPFASRCISFSISKTSPYKDQSKGEGLTNSDVRKPMCFLAESQLMTLE